MGQDLDCMICGRGTQISVFELFQWLLLPHKVGHCHDANRLHLSAFLCIYCEQCVSTPLQAQHNTVYN